MLLLLPFAQLQQHTGANASSPAICAAAAAYRRKCFSPAICASAQMLLSCHLRFSANASLLPFALTRKCFSAWVGIRGIGSLSGHGEICLKSMPASPLINPGFLRGMPPQWRNQQNSRKTFNIPFIFIGSCAFEKPPHNNRDNGYICDRIGFYLL
jgi:hypothetical protein